ncbi:MAG: type II-A CRISPR-associated protein Csn2 [Clostridia bacterium]|nr:type II-A CRISPR-associated protein Csn2 [Clostridia bacterium]
MKLAHFALDKPFIWRGDNVCTLVLEDGKFYRDTVLNLIEQSYSGDGDFVLSENNEVLRFDKYVEVISDIFSVDASLNKTIVTGLQKDMAKYAQFEMSNEFTDVFGKLNHMLSRLSYASDFDVVFDDINDIAALLKLYRLRPDCDNLCWSERFIMYMDLLRKYTKKQLFIAINLKSCFTADELNRFYKDIIYHNLNFLSIESHDIASSPLELKKILDKDMCEL